MVGGPIPAKQPGLTHYDRLELTPEATAEDLRQAFRTLSKRYHPDTTTLAAAAAAERFRAVQQAYDVLGDPQRRRVYDDQLQGDRARRSGLAMPSDPRPVASAARAMPVATSLRRALSGGEWLALLLLAIAMVFSLVFGLGLAWARGAALVRVPSWWPAAVTAHTGESLPLFRSDGPAAAAADPPVSPSLAMPGILA